MKKLIAVILILAALFGAYKFGVHRALYGSEYWILELEADDSRYDYNIHILLDGQWYQHGIYVG